MRTTFSVLTTLALCLTVAAADFFAPGFDHGQTLPADQVYPRGQIFPFSGFAPADIAAIKRDGFTMGGPSYSAHQLKTLLDGARAEQLPVIYPILPKDDDEKLTKQKLDFGDFKAKPYLRSIARQVKAVADNPQIAWWYLMPEELRPWRKNDMAFLKEAVETIHKNDPQNRPVWLYLPNHYTEEQLRPFTESLELLGKGMYPMQLGKERDRVWCRWSTESETAAVKGTNSVPLAIPEMYREPKPEQLEKLEAIVRHDIYLALTSGARGVVVFSLAKRSGFPSHERYYNAYAAVARELTGDNGIGQAFLFGEPMQDVEVEIIDGPATLDVDTGINGKTALHTYPSIASAELGYRERHLLVLVNSSDTETVKLKLNRLPADAAVIELPGGKPVDPGELSLEPYQVIVLQFIRK